MDVNKQRILVIEADKALQQQLHGMLQDYEVLLAGSRREGLALSRRISPGVVLLGLELSPNADSAAEGLAALEEIRLFSPETRVIALSPAGDRPTAIEAMHLGAQDVYPKNPLDLDSLRISVDRALHQYVLGMEGKRLQGDLHPSLLPAISCSSPSMIELCKLAQRVAPSDFAILLCGEIGTGKGRLAEAIHRLSGRDEAAYVAINCAASSEESFESEVFGVDKTDADGNALLQIGKIERADTGTLFLDQVDRLSLAEQKMLMFFFETGSIKRVGSEQRVDVTTRVICSTHRNLGDMVAAGTFREDLYYRIKVVTLDVPPLRERQGDAVLLAQAFTNRFSDEFKQKSKSLSRDAITALEAYHWPGNVRELENRIKHALIVSSGALITEADLDLPHGKTKPLSMNLKEAREETERRTLLRALAETRHNISDTADLLGVSRPTIYKLLEKFNIEPTLLQGTDDR